MTKPEQVHPHQATVITDVPQGDKLLRPEWKRINYSDMQLIKGIGGRIVLMLQDHQRMHPRILLEIPPPLRCACDVAIVHLATPLDLKAFFEADSFDFASEYMAISSHINRPLNHWPREADHLLKFRKKGLLSRLFS